MANDHLLANAEDRIASPTPLFGFKRSILGHALFFLLILAKTLVFPGSTASYVPVLKVDLVELPDILKKDIAPTSSSQLSRDISKILKQAEKSAHNLKTKAPVTAAPDEMLLHPKALSEKAIQNKNRRAMDRIKALAKIQDLNELTPSHAEAKIRLSKGNKLSPGTSTSPDAKEAAHANYLDTIRDSLRQNWFLPAWLAKQSLNAQVLIRIDGSGILRELKLMKSSSNNQFDEAVKQAVQQSQPFPPPPSELKSDLLSDGILVGFPL